MTTITSDTQPSVSVPAINFNTLGLMFISGFFATIAFDLWGQVISPALGYATLSPHGLAKSLLGSFGLPNGNFAGYFVHFYVVGLIGYPIGWMFVFAPIWQRVVGQTHWFIPSAIYGFGLWVFAIGGITSVAGLPFFLNFTGIVWVALVGHVLYGIVLVAMLKQIEKS
ncbi:MAG: hypothetical protein JJ866_21890 [Roseibium sp.]|uniref:hypothetical protein n=1 Tax=Roseibium sp. TaxID=1936156 RepID=UPI001B28EECE|nr:hypothetical protein [Roseibium sp.]MBO6511780.1 hypothetical protein [Roseibium sp.]MBO6894610.1 hypothetical protein [Roseibium sp.]MBO6928811.1 hypothetical protein [Roseibium sp.]